MGLIIWIYLLGFSLSLLLFVWVAHQPDCWVPFGTGFSASALWFITIPLAALVIVRLREFLPYARAFRASGGLPIRADVRVVSPSRRILKTMGAFCRGT